MILNEVSRQTESIYEGDVTLAYALILSNLALFMNGCLSFRQNNAPQLRLYQNWGADMVDPMRDRYYLRISKLSEVRHHADTRFSPHTLVGV